MSHQVIWTKAVLQAFIYEANLNEDEQNIMRTRAKGWSRQRQAMQFGMSVSTVDKIISRLKIKYDKAQKTSSILPPRKYSAEQLYM